MYNTSSYFFLCIVGMRVVTVIVCFVIKYTFFGIRWPFRGWSGGGRYGYFTLGHNHALLPATRFRINLLQFNTLQLNWVYSWFLSIQKFKIKKKTLSSSSICCIGRCIKDPRATTKHVDICSVRRRPFQ